VAFIHGLADLPPLPGSWGGDVAGRAIRTFLQTVTAGVGTAVLFTDVSWGPLLSAAAVAALTSLVTSLAGDPPGAPFSEGHPRSGWPAGTSQHRLIRHRLPGRGLGVVRGNRGGWVRILPP
jgi:hypothetical protein